MPVCSRTVSGVYHEHMYTGSGPLASTTAVLLYCCSVLTYYVVLSIGQTQEHRMVCCVELQHDSTPTETFWARAHTPARCTSSQHAPVKTLVEIQQKNIFLTTYTHTPVNIFVQMQRKHFFDNAHTHTHTHLRDAPLHNARR